MLQSFAGQIEPLNLGEEDLKQRQERPKEKQVEAYGGRSGRGGRRRTPDEQWKWPITDQQFIGNKLKQLETEEWWKEFVPPAEAGEQVEPRNGVQDEQGRLE